MEIKKCPQCKTNLNEVKFDIGYGLEVNSLHCTNCGFNITEDKHMKNAITNLKKQMSKEVKIIEIGTGLGIRFPNDIVKNYKLKKGEEIELKPESDGVKLSLIN